MKSVKIIAGIILVIIAVVFGMQLRSPAIRQITNKMTELKNEWVLSQAQIITQKELNGKLAEDNKNLDKKYRNAANARASLQLQLNELRGKGPGVVLVDKPGMHLYEDGLVNLSYNGTDNEFDYRIKDRPLVLTVIQQGQDWTAQVYDPMQDKNLKVSKLDVIQTEAKVKWYKKVKLGLGVAYVDGPQVSGVVGYDKTFITPIVGLSGNEVKYGAGLIRLFW